MITLQAEYAPTFVTYEVQYYLQPDEKETDLQKYVAYYPQEEGQEKKALADTQIRVFPITINGYEKPDSRLITVRADSSTVVKFYYRKLVAGTEKQLKNRKMMIRGFPWNCRKRFWKR